MIELLIAACLSTECRDFPLRFAPSEFSMMACAVHGQHEIVRWSQTHPGWKIERWTCSWRPLGSVDI